MSNTFKVFLKPSFTENIIHLKLIKIMLFQADNPLPVKYLWIGIKSQNTYSSLVSTLHFKLLQI